MDHTHFTIKDKSLPYPYTMRMLSRVENNYVMSTILSFVFRLPFEIYNFLPLFLISAELHFSAAHLSPGKLNYAHQAQDSGYYIHFVTPFNIQQINFIALFFTVFLKLKLAAKVNGVSLNGLRMCTALVLHVQGAHKCNIPNIQLKSTCIFTRSLS